MPSTMQHELDYMSSNATLAKQTNKTNSVARVSERTIPTLSAKLVPTFADKWVLHSQHGGFPMAVILDF
jgi:hypothetical protein